MLSVSKVQQLLVNLGKKISVDGMWGPESERALDSALEDTGTNVPDNNVGESSGVNDFWGRTPNFKRIEFRCPCHRCGGFPVEPQEKLILLLQDLRTKTGRPITISSGVRCAAHNAELSCSVSNSRHLLGKAADFCIAGRTADQTLALCQEYVAAGKARYAYKIDNSFVHMDIE